MEFVADESVDGNVIRALRIAGHRVRYIHETDLGSSDQHVLDIAHSGSTVLITEDKDFGDLVFARNSQHSGVLLIRLDGFSPPDKIARVMMALGHHINELQGAFTVLDKNKVRIRKQS
jgi:predicted nuclease of predicted toxin-antitoxin system